MDAPNRLCKALAAIGGAKKPVLAASAVAGAKRAAKLGYRLGQVVYFRIMGGDFLGNYASAFVVGATSDQLVLAGHDTFTAIVYPDRVYSTERFELKKAALIKREKINDPNGGFTKIKVGNRGYLSVVPKMAGTVTSSNKPRGRGRPRKDGKLGPITIGVL
jgi:hypothetical protein